MYPLKFSPVKVCNNGEIRFFPTGVHQDDDPTPTVVEEPDWKLELVENDPEPEWEMPESGIYKASESFPFIDEGVKGTEEEPFTISFTTCCKLTLNSNKKKVCRNTRCAFFFSLTIKIGSFF